MKKIVFLIGAAVVMTLTATAQQGWKDASLSFHERAKSLVAAMTLEEKINQVGHQTMEISRLGLLFSALGHSSTLSPLWYHQSA